MRRRRRILEGGLFPEDARRRNPVPLVPGRDTTSESILRARILSLLLTSNFQAAVTDACTVETTRGRRQYVYPEGWPDITASVPVTGRAWAIEVKAAGGRFRESQERKLAELEAAGWLVTRAVGEQGVANVYEEIKRQLALIERGSYESYVSALHNIQSESVKRAALREEKKLRKTLASSSTNAAAAAVTTNTTANIKS